MNRNIINHEISGSREQDHRVVVLLLLGLLIFLAGQGGEEATVPFLRWRQPPQGLATFHSDLDQEGRPRLLLTRETQDGQLFAPLDPPSPLPTSFTPFFFQPVPVNEADAALLVSVPGIGPVMAERIIARRETVGRFQSLEDLLAVSGIGKKKLEKIRKHLRI